MNPVSVETRPYIGLRYFEERDAHLFYGRDEHVTELLAKVAQNRFVAVMGSSGCGKSSLVRAGLLPELRSGMIPKAGSRWKVVEFRPGRAPMQELAEAIHSKLGVEQARNLVEEGPLGIARAVADAKLADGTNVLIIADQFEEVFRYEHEKSSQGRGTEAAEECHALTRRLLDAASQSELAIYVLLVMRSDYLGECAQFPDLPEQMSASLYLVPRLRRDQLQEAITAPVGGAIEPAVVQRLLGEVGSDPDQLPRLQHLLGRMWDKADGERLTMEDYTATGGWEKGLENHLEEVYLPLIPSQQAVCARVFQQLSELDKGRAVRRRAEMSELIEVCGSDAPEVVRCFRTEGFVTPRENPVDITHECILGEWPRLRKWLEKENRSARRLHELAEAAKDAGWQQGLKQEEEEPIRELAGLTLQNLREWREENSPTPAWARRYVTAVGFETAYGYLQFSETRDLEQKRRARGRARLLFGLLGLLLVGLAFASVEFYRQKVAAQRTAHESKARELAASSTESLGDDPERSVILAIQALNATLSHGQPPVAAAEEALHQAILSSQVRETLRGHDGEVNSVSWSPDGSRLATASSDHTAKVWDAVSGRLVLTLRGHDDVVSSVTWSPDGKRIATASRDLSAKEWDAASGQLVRTLSGHRNRIWSAVWSPDGRRLATASDDNTAKVWDAASGQELLTVHSPKAMNNVAWSRDGKWLVTASDDNTAKVWDAASGKLVLTLSGHGDRVWSAAWSPDGKRLATASDDHTAKVWDAASGKLVLTLSGHGDRVWTAVWSPDGKRLATASDDHTVRVWDAASGQEALTLRSANGMFRVAWSPDGKRLATASDDHTAKIWDATAGQEVMTLRGHDAIVFSVAWNSDGKRLATASEDRTAKIWDAASGQELLTFRGHGDRVVCVDWSPDGKRVVTASRDRTAKVWDAVGGQEVLTLRGHGDRVWCAAWSPDGKHLATVSSDHTATVWDAASWKPVLTLRGHAADVNSASWSTDGKRLATASSDGTAKVWDATSGQELLTLRGHGDRVWSVAWSPDGKRLATASDDHTAKVWDAASGQEVLTLLGHNGWVYGVAWSPDGKRLATASRDQTAKVWDTANGQPLLTLRGHDGWVYGLAWSPDGKRLATASADNTVQVYAIDLRQLLDLARSRITRDLTPDECQRYFQSKTCPPLP